MKYGQSYSSEVEFRFEGAMWEWRGPAPFHFVSVPMADSDVIKQLASGISYGWGAIAATILIGDTTWKTSIFPKDGTYIVPIKNAIRLGEQIEIGQIVSVALSIEL